MSDTRTTGGCAMNEQVFPVVFCLWPLEDGHVRIGILTPDPQGDNPEAWHGEYWTTQGETPEAWEHGSWFAAWSFGIVQYGQPALTVQLDLPLDMIQRWGGGMAQ